MRATSPAFQLLVAALTVVVVFVTGSAEGLEVFEVGDGPSGIVEGADGDMWFIEEWSNAIGRVTFDSVYTQYPVPTPNAFSGAYQTAGIAVGPDNAVWFTMGAVNQIGRIDTAGAITEFSIPTPSSGPRGIITGLDGNLWFTESDAGQVAKMTTGGTITEYPVPAGGPLLGIINGPDGNLWYGGNQVVGRMTLAGAATEFPTGQVWPPRGLTVGPNDLIWFVLGCCYYGSVDITGQVELYASPAGGWNLSDIAAGADGFVWMTSYDNQIHAIDPQTAGTTSVAVSDSPEGIAAGPDGTLWLTHRSIPGRVSRITLEVEAQGGWSERRRWHEIGPSGSGVSSLNPSPVNPNVVYAVSYDKGIYRSLDGGRTWRDFWIGEHTHNMHAVGLSVDDPDLIYATRSGYAFQLHRSEDGGGSWERIPIRSDQVMYGDPYPRRIAVPTGAPSVIVYSGGGGLYRSDDRGDSWTTINGITAHFVEADPYRSGTVWLSGLISTLVSTDTGVTWTEIPGVRGVIDMAFDPHDGDHILATATTGSPVYGEAKLYRSLDGGETFSEVETSAPIFRGLSFDPDLPGVVYGASGVGGGEAGLYRSQDGGESWDRLERRALTGWTGMDVAIVGGNRPGVLAASAQGMASSDDGGISWQDANHGMPGPQIVNITGLSSRSPMLVASTYKGIYYSPTFGRTWWRSSGDAEEFFGSGWNPVVVDPQDPGKVYTIRTYLFRSEDGGRSFRRVSDERYLNEFQIDPHDPSRWFAISVNSGRLLRSVDQGQSWQEIGTEIEGYVDRFLLDPIHPGVILVIDNEPWPNLFRSTDGGQSFELIEIDGFFSWDRADLRYDPTTPDRIFGDRLVSQDGGFSWTEFRWIPGERIHFPRLFAVDPIQPDILYGFLHYGIQYPDGSIEYVSEMVHSADACESWELFTKEGLPDDAYLTALEADRSGTYLYATVASEGRAHVYRILLRIPSPRRPGGRVP